MGLLRGLASNETGLTSREASRRLQVYGPNELPTAGGNRRLVALLRQFTHPLALLLWFAMVLSLVSGSVALAIAIFAVHTCRNAPGSCATDIAPRSLARELVPGDVLFIDEGERISADARLIEGSIEVDISALTGGSTPVERGAGDADESQRPLHSPVLVLSGTTCVAGSAVGVIHGTDGHTELGRIAALSRQVRSDMSPLERQVRRVAWMIVGVAIAVGVAVSPTGV